MCVWVTRSVVLLIITRFSVIHCTKLPLKLEIMNMEKAVNVWRKKAQVLTPIMMPKILQYIEQESPAIADKPARRLRKVCTVYVRAVGL